MNSPRNHFLARQPRLKHGSKGFTLLEMMIVVAIIAILSTLAAGYFGNNVKAARCTEGRSAILSRATSLEKCKAIYGVYNNNCNIEEGATPEGHFDISLVRDATTFTLTATATDDAASPNPFCPTITLNHLAVQGGTGTSPW